MIGKKKACQPLPPFVKGKTIDINPDVLKVVCMRGFKLADKSSRFMRCNQTTGLWSYNGTPQCIGKQIDS